MQFHHVNNKDFDQLHVCTGSSESMFGIHVRRYILFIFLALADIWLSRAAILVKEHKRKIPLIFLLFFFLNLATGQGRDVIFFFPFPVFVGHLVQWSRTS